MTPQQRLMAAYALMSEAERKQADADRGHGHVYVPPPPLGLTPRAHTKATSVPERVREITAAIERYADASHPVPAHWLDELRALTVA